MLDWDKLTRWRSMISAESMREYIEEYLLPNDEPQKECKECKWTWIWSSDEWTNSYDVSKVKIEKLDFEVIGKKIRDVYIADDSAVVRNVIRIEEKINEIIDAWNDR